MFTFDIVTFALAINSLVLKIAIAINYLDLYSAITITYFDLVVNSFENKLASLEATLVRNSADFSLTY